MEISVIVCSYNPKDVYLKRTLRALQQQQTEFLWELIIIDNNSSPPMSDLYDLTWHPHGRIVVEYKQGLTPARVRGITEATGSVLVFVDDDNVLAPDFLSRCHEKSHQWPRIGVWGGHIEPEFEVVPPEWTRPLWSYLAIKNVTQDYFSNSRSASKAEPCGAGLCIRREAALFYAQLLQSDPARAALDRKGNELTSAGDTDMVWSTLSMGYGMAMFKDLKLTHIMPAWRLSEEYLVRLARGLRFSHLVLCHQWHEPVRIPQRNALWWIRFLFRYLTLTGRSRRFYLANKQAEEMAMRTIRKLNNEAQA